MTDIISCRPLWDLGDGRHRPVREGRPPLGHDSGAVRPRVGWDGGCQASCGVRGAGRLRVEWGVQQASFGVRWGWSGPFGVRGVVRLCVGWGGSGQASCGVRGKVRPRVEWREGGKASCGVMGEVRPRVGWGGGGQASFEVRGGDMGIPRVEWVCSVVGRGWFQFM